jgi:hypothetical protein
MSEPKTAAFRQAKALAACLRQKKRLAINLEQGNGPEIVTVHSEAIWNDNDQKALESWEDYEMEASGLTKLKF